MTLVAVSIMVRDVSQFDAALREARHASEFGADLIEWRVDHLLTEDDPASIESILKLLADSPLPAILTCRPVWEGGGYDGSEAFRRDLYAGAIASDHPPKYIDLELRAVDRDSAWRELDIEPGATTSLIMSLHDFEGRPADLLSQAARMAAPRACDVIKLAWRARSIRDNLEAFDLLREKTKPTIALCMGEYGLPSRVLSAKFGGFLTFAAPDSNDDPTAPGQPTIDELKLLYRFDSIDRETRLYGVIGWPVSHSLSPHLHNAGFDEMRFNGVYLPLPVPPEWEHFKASVGSLIDHPRLDFRGASVTQPHKQHLLRFIEERGGRIDDYSRIAGAANTLLVGAAGAVVCRNTDAPAIVDCLTERLNIQPARLRDLRIAVIGCGGVGRAAVAGLLRNDASITLFNRTQATAEALAEEMQRTASQIESRGSITLADPGALAKERFDVYINCTSIGMAGTPDAERTPFEALGVADAPIDDATTVFDTVYAPPRTPLINEAESRGARVVLGTDMFIRQAALQFESWTGERASDDLFREVLWDASVS